MTRCSDASRADREPLAGTAPRADVWVVVEHAAGWGDAPLARAAHGVRVLMARGSRRAAAGAAGAASPAAWALATPGSAAEPVGSHAGTRGLPTAAVVASHDTPPRVPDGTGAVRAWVAHCGRDPVLRMGVLDHPTDVAAWDLAALAAGSHRGWGAPDPDPLLLVCANGRRDRCCGHSGGRLADELWRGPLAHRVLTCTHLGGHRFAPTALLLPSGSLHGRLDAASARGLLAAAARGSVPAGNLRGFSTLDEPEQVADAHARLVLGYEGPEPLEVRIRHVGSDRAIAEVRPQPGLTPAAHPGPGSTPAAHLGPGPMPAPLPGPGSTPAPLTIALVRTSAIGTLSCGRAPELMARWVVDDSTPT